MDRSLKVNDWLWLRSASVFLLTVSVLLVYLSPYWSFENSSRSASLIRIMILCSAFFVLPFLFRELKKANLSFFNFSLFVLFFYLILNSVFLSEGWSSLRRVLVILFLFLPFFALSFNARLVRLLVVIVAVVISLFAIYSLANKYLQGGLPTGYRKGGLVDSGTPGIASFRNTIVSAMHYSLGFVALIYLFFTESRRVLFWLWSVLLCFVSVYIMLTFARSAWLACLVAMMVNYVMLFDKSKKRFYFIAFLLLVFFAFFVIKYSGYEVGSRGLTHRDEVWLGAISQINGSWLLGYGLSASFDPIVIANGRQIVHNSHNLYLEIIYQAGLIGLLIYIALLVAAIFTLIKSFRSNTFGRLEPLVLSLLISTAAVTLVELNSWIHSPNLIWMWLWVPIAFTLVIEKRLCFTD